MFRLPSLNVVDLKVVPRILGDLFDDGDHRQWSHSIGSRQLVDGRIFRRPVGGRVELGPELVVLRL